MDAIILAGGLGTRLKTVVSELPKPMAPIAGRPFLEWQLDYLRSQGIRRCILAVGYKAEAISEHFAKGYLDMDIVIVKEPEPLGTGGAIYQALSKISSSDVLVCNGDTLFTANLPVFIDKAKHLQEGAVILAARIQECGRYGTLQVKDQSVIDFKEKAEAGPGLINAGIYYLNCQWFLKQTQGGAFSFEKFLASQVSHHHIAFVELEGEFIDIGVPEDYQKAQLYIPAILDKIIP
ncbi:MAG: hddC [Gammaproteobacteria bacterium]|jgi:D-glycero-alpha-D-manno-heptose 1-phosphate guanylyltransferase|nr:hddC [Gammaproteobacteria bacterium]